MSVVAGALEVRSGWRQALNPALYLISILPGVAVWQLSGGAGRELLWATLAVALLQHAINVLNDVSDWRMGADAEKWDSWVRAHHANLTLTSVHGWISFLCGGFLGLSVLISTQRIYILAIALPMVGLGYLYNSGKRPLSYTRMGEWVTGLCYGPGVVGCLWLLTDTPLGLRCALAMVAFAALAVALLFSHQPPQIESDRQAGKHSYAVRFGAEKTYLTAQVLLVIFFLTYGLSLATRSSGLQRVADFSVAVVATAVALRTPPNPKRILLLATSVVALSLVVARLH
jgi:1,4-dihydroxy-2-naphthoate polyprenyltransferase